MGEFHFLRPVWLLALPILAALLWRAWRAGVIPNPWDRHCDASLRATVVKLLANSATLSWAVLVIGAVVVCIALAGPSWERVQAKASQPQDARMVVLDLSLSMLATDVAPSRLERARDKVRQIFQYPYDGQFGLVVFAGAGFSVAPLTTDIDTLDAFLPVLEPSVLPLQGSRVDRGLDIAIEVLSKGGSQQGELILITDGTSGDSAAERASELAAMGFRVSVIAIGTEAGGEVEMRGGALLRNLSGDVVKPTV
ncbi:MAG: VWA domain-containing protein, partial [Gammaproteobacteria bacterium]|nr:VWA domain-containing protein [Gammaproteobacteria bacterium]